MRILPHDASVSVEQAIDHDKLHGELVDVQSRSMISRAQVFETSLGNFEWGTVVGKKEELATQIRYLYWNAWIVSY